MTWFRRILTTFRDQAHQRDLDEELRFHLEMREQSNHKSLTT